MWRLFKCYSECHYAKCRYAECCLAECRNAECRSVASFSCNRDLYLLDGVTNPKYKLLCFNCTFYKEMKALALTGMGAAMFDSIR